MRSILGQTRPDRQTLLFSATMPGKVERLVRDALTSPVRVTVGEVGAANEDIKQVRRCSPESCFRSVPDCFNDTLKAKKTKPSL